MSKSKVSLVSGWSGPGGSTIHHISLTNLLNSNGFDCTFYGPHEWHLNQCKSAHISMLRGDLTATLISHFIQIPKDLRFRKHILSCHETKLFPLKKIPLGGYNLIQYVSNSQRDWHNVNHPNVIIPPLVSKVRWVDPENGIAGVVGSIDENKQVHKSIERALAAGYKKVLLFGDVTDMPYFNTLVAKYINSGEAVLMGHEDSREVLYGQVSKVYHSSLSETYGLVEAECRLSGIPFDEVSNGQEILSSEEILERWKKVLTQ